MSGTDESLLINPGPALVVRVQPRTALKEVAPGVDRVITPALDLQAAPQMIDDLRAQGWSQDGSGDSGEFGEAFSASLSSTSGPAATIDRDEGKRDVGQESSGSARITVDKEILPNKAAAVLVGGSKSSAKATANPTGTAGTSGSSVISLSDALKLALLKQENDSPSTPGANTSQSSETETSKVAELVVPSMPGEAVLQGKAGSEQGVGELKAFLSEKVHATVSSAGQAKGTTDSNSDNVSEAKSKLFTHEAPSALTIRREGGPNDPLNTAAAVLVLPATSSVTGSAAPKSLSVGSTSTLNSSLSSALDITRESSLKSSIAQQATRGKAESIGSWDEVEGPIAWAAGDETGRLRAILTSTGTRSGQPEPRGAASGSVADLSQASLPSLISSHAVAETISSVRAAAKGKPRESIAASEDGLARDASAKNLIVDKGLGNAAGIAAPTASSATSTSGLAGGASGLSASSATPTHSLNLNPSLSHAVVQRTRSDGAANESFASLLSEAGASKSELGHAIDAASASAVQVSDRQGDARGTQALRAKRSGNSSSAITSIKSSGRASATDRSLATSRSEAMLSAADRADADASKVSSDDGTNDVAGGPIAGHVGLSEVPLTALHTPPDLSNSNVVPVVGAAVVHREVVTAGVSAQPLAGITANASTQAIGATAAHGSSVLDATMASEPHQTLAATPTSLEVGMHSGTQGWLKIRAEVGDQGDITASLAASSVSGEQALKGQLPALNAYLHSEQMSVTTSMAERIWPAHVAVSHETGLPSLSAGAGSSGQHPSLLGGAGQNAHDQNGRQSSDLASAATGRSGRDDARPSFESPLEANAGGRPTASASEVDGSGQWLNVRV